MKPIVFLEVSDGEWAKAEEEQKAIVTYIAMPNLGRQAETASRSGSSHQMEIAETDSATDRMTLLLNERKLQELEFSSTEQLEAWKRKYGEDHPTTIERMKKIAYMYMHRGAFKKAQPLFRKIRELVTRRFGAEDVYTLDIMFDVGMAFAVQGSFQDAREPWESFIEKGKWVLAQPTSTLTCLGKPALDAMEDDTQWRSLRT